MSELENARTVILGAGAAGLATAACLRQAGLEAVVLERSGAIGASWRRHYDRLHLHTYRGHSGLPHRPMPASYPRYPSRDQVVAYLEEYAAHFEIEPRFQVEVTAVRRDGDAWLVEGDGAGSAPVRLRTAHVVIATGYSRVPLEPRFPAQESFSGPVVHSSRYRNGEEFRGKRVLVVGFGNSGGEIAIDLHEHGATPTLAVRSPVNIVPREVLGIPILTLGIATSRLPPAVADAIARPLSRLTVGDLARLGLRRADYGPARQIRERHRIPLIDVGTIALIKRGAIEVRPGLDRFTGDGVVFSDGSSAPFDAVILATGYRPRLDQFLDPANVSLQPGGAPAASGQELSPGLFCCGFYVSPTGMLREIGLEAPRIAAAIAARAASVE